MRKQLLFILIPFFILFFTISGNAQMLPDDVVVINTDSGSIDVTFRGDRVYSERNVILHDSSTGSHQKHVTRVSMPAEVFIARILQAKTLKPHKKEEFKKIADKRHIPLPQKEEGWDPDKKTSSF